MVVLFFFFRFCFSLYFLQRTIYRLNEMLHGLCILVSIALAFQVYRLQSVLIFLGILYLFNFFFKFPIFPIVWYCIPIFGSTFLLFIL